MRAPLKALHDLARSPAAVCSENSIRACSADVSDSNWAGRQQWQPGLSVGSQDADSVQLNTCNRAAHSRTVSGCFHGVSFMNLRTHFPVMLGEYWVYVLAGIISITILMLLYSQ
jgi:hypothetical protein